MWKPKSTSNSSGKLSNPIKYVMMSMMMVMLMIVGEQKLQIMISMITNDHCDISMITELQKRANRANPLVLIFPGQC